ncbi:MAG: sigma-54 interaction domain-containing protein [Sporomusa sp.]
MKDSTINAATLTISKFEKALTNTCDSFFVVDGEGVVIYVNPAACRFLDMTEEQLAGNNVRNLQNTGFYNPSIALQALQKKEIVWGIVKTRSGKELITVASPLFDKEGNVVLVTTNSKEKDDIDQFLSKFEQERLMARKYLSEIEYLRKQNLSKEDIVHASKAMNDILHKLKIVAKTDSPIFVSGESGTGKDLMANFLHKNSVRSSEAFIAVNCAAIPEALMESELFGYEKGAFTGASAQGKMGLIELADNGTLFLDEIAELSLALQSKLLRALESREFRRVGGVKGRRVDFRLITATNKNLKKMVQENLFREDLYYRINVIPVEIPPLRERPEDILALIDMFLQELNRKYGYKKSFAPKTIDALLSYQWPGNVRELRNIVERLLVTSTEDQVSLEDESWFKDLYPNHSQHTTNTELRFLANISQGSVENLKDVVAITEKQHIQNVLDLCGGQIDEASKRLGIHQSCLYKKMKTLQISKKKQS